MNYYVYKIINNINNKIYVGVHGTNNFNDEYFGSGNIIKNAVKKYGVENFTKKMLYCTEFEHLAYKAEVLLVTEEFVKRKDTYNIKPGGKGGWKHVNENYPAEKRKISGKKGADSCARLSKTDPEWVQRKRENQIKGLAEARAKGWDPNINNKNFPNPMFGKHHTEETKTIIGRKAKERLADPTKNGSYRTIWITTGLENRKIKKDDLIPEGWYKGRKY